MESQDQKKVYWLSKSSFVGFITKKFLAFDKSQPFISITAIFAFFGVVLGVAVLMVAMGIMNGFDKEFRKKLFTMNYPITIRPVFDDTLDQNFVDALSKKIPHIKLSPYTRTQGIAKKGSYMEGVIVFGVEPDLEKEINIVYKKAIDNIELKPFDLVIGEGLKDEMFLDLKQKLMIIFTHAQPVGLASTPAMKRFDIRSTFSSGLVAYDKAYVYAKNEDLRKILNLDNHTFHGIHVFSNNPHEDIIKIKASIQDGYSVVGWWEQNGNFFSALALEKKAMFIVLMLIVLVASVNIITSLLMTIMSRRRDIALMLSLGATRVEIKKIFFNLGLIIGVCGIIFGSLLGGVCVYLLTNFEIISIPADVYGTSKLPMELSLEDFFAVLVGAFVIVVISAWYPAKKSSEIDSLLVLRNE